MSLFDRLAWANDILRWLGEALLFQTRLVVLLLLGWWWWRERVAAVSRDLISHWPQRRWWHVFKRRLEHLCWWWWWKVLFEWCVVDLLTGIQWHRHLIPLYGGTSGPALLVHGLWLLVVLPFASLTEIRLFTRWWWWVLRVVFEFRHIDPFRPLVIRAFWLARRLQSLAWWWTERLRGVSERL